MSGRGRGQNYQVPGVPLHSRGRGANYNFPPGPSVLPIREMHNGLPVTRNIKMDPVTGNYKLYVKSIPHYYDKLMVTNIFSKAAEPVNVYLSGIRQEHPLQYAFIEYRTYMDCYHTIELINGNPLSDGITAEFAKEKSEFQKEDMTEWVIKGEVIKDKTKLKMFIDNSSSLETFTPTYNNLLSYKFPTVDLEDLENQLFKEVVKKDDLKPSTEKCRYCQFVGARRGCGYCGTVYCKRECLINDQSEHTKYCLPKLSQDVGGGGDTAARSRDNLSNGFHNNSLKEDDRRSDTSFGNRSSSRHNNFRSDNRLNQSDDRHNRSHNSGSSQGMNEHVSPINTMFERRKSRIQNERENTSRRSDQDFNTSGARNQNQLSKQTNDDESCDKQMKVEVAEVQNSNENLPLGLKFLNQEKLFSTNTEETLSNHQESKPRPIEEKICSTSKTGPEFPEHKSSFTSSTPKTEQASQSLSSLALKTGSAEQTGPKLLAPNVYNEVMVRHRTARTISIVPLNKLTLLQNLMTNLQTLASSEDVIPSTLNMRCIVRSSTDKQWYRGKVVNVNPLTVKLVDNGREEVCSPNCVRSIPEELTKISPLVCSVQPKDDLPEEILNKDIISVKVIHQDPNTKGWVVDVMPVSVTAPADSPRQPAESELIYPEIFKPDQFTTVVITTKVEGDNMDKGIVEYMVGPKDILSRIFEMHKFFEKDTSIKVNLNIKVGAIGLKRFGEEWYRVRVSNCDPLTVYFMDFGTTEQVEAAEQLKRCPETHKTIKRLVYKIRLASGTDAKYCSLADCSELSVKPVSKLPDNTVVVHVEGETYTNNTSDSRSTPFQPPVPSQSPTAIKTNVTLQDNTSKSGSTPDQLPIPSISTAVKTNDTPLDNTSQSNSVQSTVPSQSSAIKPDVSPQSSTNQSNSVQSPILSQSTAIQPDISPQSSASKSNPFLSPIPSQSTEFKTNVPSVESKLAVQRMIDEFPDFLPADKFSSVVITVADKSEKDFTDTYLVGGPNVIGEYMKLCDLLYSQKQSFQPVQPQLGNLCLAEYESCWNRVTVVSLSPLRVYYMDYGNTENADIKDLRKCPDNFQTMKPLVCKIKLASGTNMKYFGIAEDSTLSVKPVSKLPDNTVVVHVEGETYTNNTSDSRSTPFQPPVPSQSPTAIKTNVALQDNTRKSGSTPDQLPIPSISTAVKTNDTPLDNTSQSNSVQSPVSSQSSAIKPDVSPQSSTNQSNSVQSPILSQSTAIKPDISPQSSASKSNPVLSPIPSQSTAFKTNVPSVESKLAIQRTIDEFPDFLPADKFSSVVITVADKSEKDFTDTYLVGGPNVIGEYMKLCDLLYSQKQSFQPVQPQLGNLCLAEYESCWNRVTVVSVSPLRVYYMDYGNTENADIKDLRKCPDNFQTMKPLVCKIKLAPGTNMKYFGLAEDSTLSVKPVSKLAGNLIEVFVEGEVYRDIARPLPLEVQPSPAVAEPILNLLQEGHEVVFIDSFPNARTRSVIRTLCCNNIPESLIVTEDEFEVVMRQAPKDPSFRPKEGDLVGLKNDDVWTRGRIVADDKNLVELVDSGLTVWCNEFVKLPEQFTSLPFLASELDMENQSLEVFNAISEAGIQKGTVMRVEKGTGNRARCVLVRFTAGFEVSVRSWSYKPLEHPDPLTDGEVVLITKVVDSQTFMVQRATDIADLQKIQIQCRMSSALKFETSPQVGDYGVYFEEEAGGFRRMKIEEINTETGQCSFYDIDRGDKAKGSLSKLSPMTPSVRKIPCQASRVLLNNVDKKELTEEFQAYVVNIVQKEVQMKVTLGAGCTVILTDKDGNNINRVLQDLLTPKVVLDLNDKFTLRSLPPLNPKMNQEVLVTPSLTDPLYFQFRSQAEDYFNNYNDDIQIHCETHTASYNPAENELCLAKFDEDQLFYRCLCVRESRNGIASLQLIDFGNFFKAPTTDIRQITETFLKIPALGLSSKLVGLSEERKAQILPTLVTYSNHKVILKSVDDVGNYSIEYISKA